ncbi:MAG TPA: tetratricopeptide repeat protein [Phycisphaerae bacterium]|nr:tetratricopeptide repeat protein [Phycisphaerae bacterium]
MAAPPTDGRVARVRSRVFDVEYHVNPAAEPLESVRLWYTLDRGSTWRLYGQDEDRQSPLCFNAAEEGLYGFYFVAGNATGTSGREPASGSPPQYWAYVDYTLPVVQLHPPQVDPRASSTAVVSIRWTAIDAHLPPRPVELAFRMAPDGQWRAIADNLANTGRYDWRVPEEVSGRVDLRIAVVDEGGNRAEAVRAYDLAPLIATPSGMEVSGEGDEVVATLTASSRVIDEGARQRSRKLYEQGMRHRDRGERKLAMARLRDALKLDPGYSMALVDLGGLLYGEGDQEAALEAYQLALEQDPYLRSAVEGAAKVHIARREFDEAGEQLWRILRRDPEDAEFWLNLGDVAIYRGDELSAREHYERAANLDSTATEIVERAQKRLADISGLRRRYQQHGQANRSP